MARKKSIFTTQLLAESESFSSTENQVFSKPVGRGENGTETFRIPGIFSKTESIGWNCSKTETNLEIFSRKQNRI
uniref:Uncharacterized protein n=1 Tax=Oryza sativa subsp. japonica TaxID=39947 RepID=Q6K224_ORYSJ|nr:hypothetical protein [Oryza sativa Japonica Group]